MSVSIVQSLSVADACQAVPLLPSLLAWRQTLLPTESGVALVVPENENPRELGVDTENCAWLGLAWLGSEIGDASFRTATWLFERRLRRPLNQL